MNKTLKFVSGVALLAVFAIASAFSFSEGKEEILEIGAKAPMADKAMMDVSGQDISLSDAAGKNGLLVIFSCNTCPFVIGNGTKTEGWEGRYPGLYDLTASVDMGMVLVNSNEAKRSAGDNLDDMKARYKEQGLKGNYVLDKNHALADAFGALTTPHVFLFDGNMNLIYKGAIDDSVDSADSVSDPYLLKAIKNHIGGQPINPNSTKQLGCSIKRVKA
ncbi:MAG: redoxin family protein [Bacteroidota bacterium]